MNENRGIGIDKSEIACPLTEAHFCGLQSQSNIYGICKIDLPATPCEILVSSLRGKVVSLRFSKTNPVSREVRFTYIPGDAEIISIDAFRKLYHGSNIVIGIAFVKFLDGKSYHYLNVYSDWERSKDYNLDSIAQSWHNIELSYTPYQLTHTEYVHDGNVEVVILLSGCDSKIHVFREEKEFAEVSDVCSCFPEFANLPGNVTWLQCEYYQEYQRRVSALGFFSGLVQVTVVNTQTLEIISKCEIEHDSPVTNLRLFTLKTDVECPHFITQVVDTLDDDLEDSCPDLHLLVTSALEPAVVYKSVLDKQFNCPSVLSTSDQYDCTLCGCVADVDLDGQNEIIVGTYGQQMLAYKFFPTEETTDEPESKITQETDKTENDEPDGKGTVKKPESLNLSLSSKDSKQVPVSPLDFNSGHFDTTPLGNAPGSLGDTDTSHPLGKTDSSVMESRNFESLNDSNHLENDFFVPRGLSDKEQLELDFSEPRLTGSFSGLNLGSRREDDSTQLPEGEFRLLWQQSFSDPVFAIDSLDITGDGLEDLVVLSQKGIHVLQHDPDTTAKVCFERLKQATISQGAQDDVFRQLLSENLAGSYQDNFLDNPASLK